MNQIHLATGLIYHIVAHTELIWHATVGARSLSRWLQCLGAASLASISPRLCHFLSWLSSNHQSLSWNHLCFCCNSHTHRFWLACWMAAWMRWICRSLRSGTAASCTCCFYLHLRCTIFSVRLVENRGTQDCRLSDLRLEQIGCSDLCIRMLWGRVRLSGRFNRISLLSNLEHQAC